MFPGIGGMTTGHHSVGGVGWQDGMGRGNPLRLRCDGACDVGERQGDSPSLQDHGRTCVVLTRTRAIRPVQWGHRATARDGPYPFILPFLIIAGTATGQPRGMAPTHTSCRSSSSRAPPQGNREGWPLPIRPAVPHHRGHRHRATLQDWDDDGGRLAFFLCGCNMRFCRIYWLLKVVGIAVMLARGESYGRRGTSPNQFLSVKWDQKRGSQLLGF